MTRSPLYVGVDIGGTNTVFGFVTADGAIVSAHRFPTNAQAPAEDLVDRLAAAIREAFAPLEGAHALAGIGIGAPNANYYRGTVEYPPNLAWEVVPFVALMQRHFSVPIVITNDANAAALGEKHFGKARELDDFFVITLGTGLGSGIVSGGRLLLGHDGFAGEMGHMMVEPDSDRVCGCGKRGCLETYASATGIVRTARALLADEDRPSALRALEVDALTAKDIAQAAEQGDALALECFEITGRVLGVQLANGVAVASPAAIFLFGGLVHAGDLLLEPVRRHFEAALLPIFRRTGVYVDISGLQDKNAAVLGAAALAVQETAAGR